MKVNINLLLGIIQGLVLIIQTLVTRMFTKGKFYNPHPPGESAMCIKHTEAIARLETKVEANKATLTEIKNELKGR